MDGEIVQNVPLVSVIIPTYNRPSYLRRSIDSVLNQSYKNLEIFIVDDNNPDTDARGETERLMKEYENIPSVIYIKHDKNRNGSAARNTGWRLAHGDYITFLDDDDVINPQKIEKQLLCLEALDNTWGACYTGYKLIKEHGNNQISFEKRSGNCYEDALMRTLYMGSGSNLFLRKSVVDIIKGYDESFTRNQDIEFLARVLEHYNLAYIDEYLLTIFQEGDREERTFEELERYTKYYLKCFSGRINELEEKRKERVMAVISLERFRVALSKHKLIYGLKILKENHISILYILKYIKYILYRAITHKSYGFNGK